MGAALSVCNWLPVWAPVHSQGIVNLHWRVTSNSTHVYHVFHDDDGNHNWQKLIEGSCRNLTVKNVSGVCNLLHWTLHTLESFILFCTSVPSHQKHVLVCVITSAISLQDFLWNMFSSSTVITPYSKEILLWLKLVILVYHAYQTWDIFKISRVTSLNTNIFFKYTICKCNVP